MNTTVTAPLGMKKISLAVWMSVMALTQAQQSGVVPVSSPAPSAEENKAGKESPLAGSSNPEVQRLLSEAQNLQGRHRYFDALAKLDEAQKLDPNDANIPNVRGAIYLVPALRRYDEAKTEFEKALELQKGALAPQFNLAELQFVQHKFPEAEAAFSKLLEEFPKLPLAVRHLVNFKLLISLVKQEKLDAAEKVMKDNFTFMDDTPAYYYSKAALAFQRKNEAEAQEWLIKAGVIFKQAETSAYVDSLMEARWVPNIALPVEETK
jgi:Flp pilus assembly protein TadD